MEIDLEQLASEAAEHLDQDPRYWDEVEGAFTWWGARVYYTKHQDWIVLEVGEVELTIARP